MDKDGKMHQDLMGREGSTARSPKAKRAPKGRWLFGICICLLLVDVLFGCLVAVLAGRRRRPGSTCPYPEKFCLPCKSLRLSPGENKYHFMEFGHHLVHPALDADCCAENPEGLQRLLEIFVKRKQRIRRLKELEKYSVNSSPNSKHERPAAHLVKSTPSVVIITEANHNREAEWDDVNHNNLSFVKVFTRKGHTLTVPETGYYYVYSQLIFEESSNTSRVPGQACHVLMRQSAYDDQSQDKLLTNSVTISGGVSKSPSSYLGAVFYLNLNDTIWIKVNGTGTQLNPKKHTNGNFFGLYKV